MKYTEISDKSEFENHDFISGYCPSWGFNKILQTIGLTVIRNEITYQLSADGFGVHTIARLILNWDSDGQFSFILEDKAMKKLIFCEFNIDMACVELRFTDGSMISIDCTAIEDEVAHTICQRSELDWLVYNAPIGYADLILNGDLEQYLKNISR